MSDQHDPGQLAARAAGLLDEAGARTMALMPRDVQAASGT